MPRLFPSLRRSNKARDRANDYSAHNDYSHYEQQQYPAQAPAWGRVVPQAQPRDTRHESWAEEVIEYPESYSGLGDYHRGTSTSRGYRRTPAPSHDFDVHSESTVTPLDDHHGAQHGGHYDPRYDSHFDTQYGTPYGRDSAVPIVQRESSLTRLQEAFADRGQYGGARPVTEVQLPQGTPRTSPRDAVPRNVVPPVPPPPVPVEVRNVYSEQRQPVLVPNMTARSVEPEFVRSTSHRGRSDDRNYHSRERRRERSVSSGRSVDGPEHDYPPCVIVVEKGRHGKKDTYYVIPGGAPVIFEDDKGRELTRVGDFSGRYRPQQQRPVIIEDERGNEIGRLGFDDESSLDYAHRNRSDEDFYARDREYNHQHRHRDYDNRSLGQSYRMQGSTRYPESNNPRRDYSRSRKDSTRSPNVIYLPPSTSSRSSSRHSGRSSQRRYQPSHHSSNTSRSSASPVIHLDQFRRPSGSVSSGSSGQRSHGSARR